MNALAVTPVVAKAKTSKAFFIILLVSVKSSQDIVHP
jgi:hypothetical protein